MALDNTTVCGDAGSIYFQNSLVSASGWSVTEVASFISPKRFDVEKLGNIVENYDSLKCACLF